MNCLEYPDRRKVLYRNIAGQFSTAAHNGHCREEQPFATTRRGEYAGIEYVELPVGCG